MTVLDGYLSALYDLEDARMSDLREAFARYREDQARVLAGLPALHARFVGPTPRRRYSRRDRRRRFL